MDDNKYTAPVEGNYVFSKTAYISKPTGRKIEVKNENRHWFQFWKPKTVLIDEMSIERIVSKSESMRLQKGDTVDVKVVIPKVENEG